MADAAVLAAEIGHVAVDGGGTHVAVPVEVEVGVGGGVGGVGRVEFPVPRRGVGDGAPGGHHQRGLLAAGVGVRR